MKIIIEIIPHNEQRYNTVGDWQFSPDKQQLNIKVSKQETWQYDAAVAVHELVEALLCRNDEVEESDVDEFDFDWEEKKADSDEEPGDNPQAPYATQHCIATGIERLLIAAFGLNWKPYDDGIVNLVNGRKEEEPQ